MDSSGSELQEVPLGRWPMDRGEWRAWPGSGWSHGWRDQGI